MMSLVACAVCRQPFYASCHDGACLDAACPYCAYADAGTEAAEVLDGPAGAPTVSVAALIRIAGVQEPPSQAPVARTRVATDTHRPTTADKEHDRDHQ